MSGPIGPVEPINHEGTVTLHEALQFIQGTGGKITSLRFIKRTTGEYRDMVFRTGVKSHLAGGEPAYDFAEKGLIPVFDMNAEPKPGNTGKGDYRSIPREGITHIKMDGKWMLVKQPGVNEPLPPIPPRPEKAAAAAPVSQAASVKVEKTK